MSVGDALVKAGCARRESALFGAVRYLPSHEAVDRVVNKLRAELLEEGVITEEAALLAVLLDKSNQMKMFFPNTSRGRFLKDERPLPRLKREEKHRI